MSKDQFISEIKDALAKSDIDYIREILKNSEHNINANDQYGCPLIWYFFDDLKKIDLDKIEQLKEFNVYFNVKLNNGEILINKIIAAENIAAVRAILEYSKDQSLIGIKDGHGNYPVHMALKTGNQNMVRLLAEEFAADLNIKHENGNSLLGQEIINGNNGMALLLIELGAALDIKNDAGEAPLHLAVKYNRSNVIAKLIDMGADLYIVDGKGKDPIDYAFEDNKIHIIEALIQGGVKVDYQDKCGNTMLMKAVGIEDNDPYNHIIVGKLIGLGADCNALNKKGESIVKKIIKNNDLNSLKSIFNPSLPNQTILKKEIISREKESWSKIAMENENPIILKFLLEEGILSSLELNSNNPIISDILEQYNNKPQHKTLKKIDTEEENSNADSENESDSDIDELPKQLGSFDNIEVEDISANSESEQLFKNKVALSLPIITEESTPNISGSSGNIVTYRKSISSPEEGEQSYSSTGEEYKVGPKKSWAASKASDSSSSFSELRKNKVEKTCEDSCFLQTNNELSPSPVSEIGEKGLLSSDAD